MSSSSETEEGGDVASSSIASEDDRSNPLSPAIVRNESFREREDFGDVDESDDPDEVALPPQNQIRKRRGSRSGRTKSGSVHPTPGDGNRDEEDDSEGEVQTCWRSMRCM